MDIKQSRKAQYNQLDIETSIFIKLVPKVPNLTVQKRQRQISKAVVSNGRQFCSLGTMWQYLETSLVVATGKGRCYWHLGDKHQGGCYISCNTHIYLVQNVNTAKAEKSCSTRMKQMDKYQEECGNCWFYSPSHKVKVTKGHSL